MWLYVLLVSFLWAAVWFFRDRQMLSSFKDKYVFITGCDSGFGNMLAKRLDKKGFHVLAGCLTLKGADSLKRAMSPNLRTTLIDVTNSESIRKAVEWVQKEVGDKGKSHPVGIRKKTQAKARLESSAYSEVEQLQRPRVSGSCGPLRFLLLACYPCFLLYALLSATGEGLLAAMSMGSGSAYEQTREGHSSWWEACRWVEGKEIMNDWGWAEEGAPGNCPNRASQDLEPALS